MGQHILVPFDDSEPAKKALEYAITSFPDANVTAMFVVPVHEDYWLSFHGDPKSTARFEEAKEDAETLLEEARQIAANLDSEIDTELEAGKPQRVIVDRSDEFDAVVMGSHSRDTVGRVLLGSVAETVVRRAPVPVTVIR